MQDTARHSAPQPDEVRHTLTVRDVERLLSEAGVPRSHRHVLRMCQTGMLDAVKFPGGPTGDEWHIAPASVPKAIGDLKQIDAQRVRRSGLQPAMSDHVAVEKQGNSNTDTARHSALQPATADKESREKISETEPATARYSRLELDIYEHPYVKKLEDRVEKLETKYEAQVRRTEEIQIKSQQQIIELQRMTAIGQSETLADFMLRAKDWILGQGSEPDKREAGDATGR